MIGKIWTAFVLFCLWLAICAWLVAVCHEKDIHPIRDFGKFLKKQPVPGRVFWVFFFLFTLVVAATKPDPGGTGGDGVGGGEDGTNTVQTVGRPGGVARTKANRGDCVQGGLDGDPGGGGLDGDAQAGTGSTAVADEWTDFTPITSTNTTRQLTGEDFRRGFVMTGVGTDGPLDFAPPPGATVCADWRAFGAASDWVYLAFTNWAFRVGMDEVDRLRVFSFGRVEPFIRGADGAAGTDNWFSPFEAVLGVVPEANWGRLAEAEDSGFWHLVTPSNTLQLTWRNVLLDRDTATPVSFQAEFWPEGRFVFRYDLSRLGVEAVSNIVAGACFGGNDWTTNALPTNVTSMAFAPLSAEDAADPDPDGDGIPTIDELFVYGTDPHAADTDHDGLSDGREVLETSTDPLDPHSLDPRYPDGVAWVIGDVDPFSCPEGSTNTVWEHVFYTGTTNAPFAYPQSSDGSAVLRVAVSGSGSGELVVGDRVVPLLGAQAAPARAGARRARSADGFGAPLLVQVTRGEDLWLFLRGDGGLSIDLNSDDFAFGVLPSWSAVVGFVNFPNTEAEAPCIHDFNARRKRVTLPVRSGAELLTCTWQGGGMDAEVENEPPRSALITASFPAGASRDVSYTLGHPLYLFGRTTYAQKVRFCPKPAEPDDPDADPEPTPPWFDDGEGDDSDGDDDEHPERWCCVWGTCCGEDGTCSCGCDCCGPRDGDGWSEGEEPAETCPVHHVSYEQCASLHDAAYADAARQVQESEDVLKIRDPLDYDLIRLPCPTDHHKCCDCPDHRTNYVAVAYKSRRLSLVDENGNNFSSSGSPCTVRVAGVRPSSALGDATLGFVTNGVVFRTYDYTVLGVGFSKRSGPPLDVYNGLSRTMGVPMTVTTNVNHALQLDLVTNVALPSGDVRFSIEADDGGQFTVWTYDYGRGQYLRLLDTDGRSVVNLSIARWRRLVGGSSGSYSPVTPIYVTSAAKGSATLRIGYWCMDGGRIVQDWQSQLITSVEPPLLPDYNRDGRANEADVEAHLRELSYWYWQNQDTLRGEFIPDGGCGDVLNTSDNVVNGPLDLVNFFPVALRVSPLVEHWGAGVSCYLESDAGDNSFKFCLADVAWSAVGSIQTNDVRSVDGERLCHAQLVSMPEDGWRIPWGTLGGFRENGGILVAEAVRPYVSLRLTFRAGDEVLYSYALPMSIVPVREMYRFYSLRGAETADGGAFPLPSPGWAHALPEEKDLDVFFTHGFNVGSDDARIWGDVLFKRFWLSGSRARFNMVTWAGDYNWTGSWANGLHYQQDVYQALRTGDALKRLLEREQSDPGKRLLLTQSLGNMVACEALRQGLRVKSYFMFDAAVASESLDGSLQDYDESVRAKYVPSDWNGYPSLCWASNWFRWFNRISGDSRGDMGWPNRYQSALSNATSVYNYFSSGDPVFMEESSVPGVTTGVFHWPTLSWSWPFVEDWNITAEANCWQKQETHKGVEAVAGTLLGGWGFGCYTMVNQLDEVELSVISAQEAESMVSDGSITNTPVFAIAGTQMQNSAATINDIYLALAKYVPAVSSPMGGTEAATTRVENHNLNDPDYRDGWGRDHVVYSDRWFHSDMKDMAYFYVYPLYEELKVKGELR